MDGQQIFDNFRNGEGTGTLESMAEQLAQLNGSYRDRAESIAALQEQMGSAWTGDAGAQAREGAGPLKNALIESAKNFDQTVGSMADQSSSWNSAARSVEPVPPMPEKPSPWTTGLKAAIPVAGPFMAADDVRTYQEGVVAHTAASVNNVAVMENYTAATSGNVANIAHEYTVLEPGSASVSLKTSTPGGISGDVSTIPGATHSSGVSGPGAGPVTVAGGPVSGAVPQANAPATTGAGPSAPPVTGGGPGVNTPNVGISGTTGPGVPTGIAGATNVPPHRTTPPGTTRPDTGAGRSPFGTSTNRGTSGNSRGGTGTPRNTTGTGPGSGRGGSGFGERAGSRLYGPGAGAGRVGGGEAVGGGRAAANAEGGARALGAGKTSGVGMTGNAAAAAESAAARGAAGARGGAMGPVAGGANRGQGAEDDEHQRASYLQENDPDEVFIGDLGQTAPPVIGE